MTVGNGEAGGGRPARRALGVPGQPRAEEWQEPAPSVLEDGPVTAPGAVPAVTAAVAAVAAVAVEVVAAVEAAGAVPVEVVHQKSAPSTSPADSPAELPEELPEDFSADLPGLPAEDGPGLRAELEAILMIVDEPAAEAHLAAVLERPRAEVASALRGLSAEYTAQGRGFDLRQVAGGWRFHSRATCAPAVDRFVLDGQQARLTQAALETLAVVAYRQPVSRSRVSAVRGVNCDGVMRTLVQRGLVEEAGSEPETGAILYRTTNYFLERMGLRGLDELPELAPFLPEVDDVEAESLEGTMIAEAVAAAAAKAADGSGEAGRAAPDR
ncbi:Segregation and condensation protein B [Kitasatospora purpeofusca]